MESTSAPDAHPQIEYPVEFARPDIKRWRQGNTGVPFVHSFKSGEPGPHLLITAIVHGNEIAGAVALDRLLSRGILPARGQLTLAFANTPAYAAFDADRPCDSRWIDEDLNRVWSREILDADPPRSAEVARARELRPFVDSADFLLDVHTMQHPNEPLVLAGPLERSRGLARWVGLADMVIIDAGHAQGVRMRDYGAFGDPTRRHAALLVECGQHWAAGSVDVAYAVCLRMLDRLGMLLPGFAAGANIALPEEATRFVEITHPVTIRKDFRFALPLRGGEVIPKAGTTIGYDGDDVVVTPYDDCVAIMPSQRLWAGLTAVRLGRMIATPAPTTF